MTMEALRRAFMAGHKAGRDFAKGTTDLIADEAFGQWYVEATAQAHRIDVDAYTDRQLSNVLHNRDKDDNGEFTASSMGAATDGA